MALMPPRPLTTAEFNARVRYCQEHGLPQTIENIDRALWRWHRTQRLASTIAVVSVGIGGLVLAMIGLAALL